MSGHNKNCVPAACTLPTGSRSLRVAEFDELFRTALRGQRRLSATRLRWDLSAEAEPVVRHLVAREQRCCAFFTLTVTPMAGAVRGGGGGARGVRRGVGRVGGARGGALLVSGLRSGELAAAAGVNPQTLRYYERRGLLAVPARSPGGHRWYPPEAVTVLRVVKAAQRLGFRLDEVTELLAVGRSPGAPAVRARAVAKLAEVEARIAEVAG